MANRHAYMCRQNICTVKTEIENFKRDRENMDTILKHLYSQSLGVMGSFLSHTSPSFSLVCIHEWMYELVI